MGPCNGARGVVAIGMRPALPQPVRGVEQFGILAFQNVDAFSDTRRRTALIRLL